jgi:hypothetical protein
MNIINGIISYDFINLAISIQRDVNNRCVLRYRLAGARSFFMLANRIAVLIVLCILCKPYL